MKILTLTGPSCSGKTTLLSNLVENHGYQNIVSHTTRPMRPGEIYGKDYYFVDENVFNLMKQNNMFIESVSFSGYNYGVGIEELESAYRSGKTAVLIVEPKGLMQILRRAKERKDIQVNSVYLGGDLSTLMSRYLKRLAGEDLSAEGVAERHAKRIQSMINERIQWAPYEGKDISLMDDICPSTIPYELVLKELGPENSDEVIKQIKEMDFKND